SMMVHFRKRFTEEVLKRINELIAEPGKAMLMETVASLSEMTTLAIHVWAMVPNSHLMIW
ncbi:MAG: hypothetical protein ACK53L_15785, partial [Pirellulaceae bacterium]